MNYRVEAVSPVIGVILMVAITIVLAAIVSMFVMGFATDVDTVKSVGVTAKRVDNTTVQVMYTGGPDNQQLKELKIHGTEEDGSWTGDDLYVGKLAEFKTKNVDDVGQTHLVVTAEFNDGSEQVLFASDL